MSSPDLQAGRLDRLLRSPPTAGLGIGERNEAGRTAPPTADEPTDPANITGFSNLPSLAADQGAPSPAATATARRLHPAARR
jgi:hypothetical protein